MRRLLLLAALGTGPGPQVGACLRRLMDIVTDDPAANTREALLAHVREMAA